MNHARTVCIAPKAQVEGLIVTACFATDTLIESRPLFFQNMILVNQLVFDGRVSDFLSSCTLVCPY